MSRERDEDLVHERAMTDAAVFVNLMYPRYLLLSPVRRCLSAAGMWYASEEGSFGLAGWRKICV